MGQGRTGPAYKLWVAVERYRRNEGLTWDELAKRANVGRQTLDRLRDGKEPPRLRTVHKVAAAIGLKQKEAEALAGWESLDLVVEEEIAADAAPATPTQSTESRRADAREAIKHDPRLDARGRAVLLAAFDAIAARADGQPTVPRPAEQPPYEPGEERRRAG